MTTELHAVPKPQPRTEAERHTHRVAQLRKLERSRRQPIAKRSQPLAKQSLSKSQSRPIPARAKKKIGRNKQRQAREFARAYGEYAVYIRSLPCLICGHHGHTVAAHSRTGGMSRKSDAKWLVPLCCSRFGVEGCHEESHNGIRTFEARYRIDLKAIAATLWAGWSARMLKHTDSSRSRMLKHTGEAER